jgi:hypothetical protein
MKLFSCLATLLFAAAAAHATPATDDLIAKARAYLGPETKLNAITSIDYAGTLVSEQTDLGADGKATKQSSTTGIEIIFQKPYRERVVLRSGKGTDIVVLDDYDCWRKTPAAGSKPARLMILDIDQVRSNRATTWENLAFYRGIEECGGRLDDLGAATVDGIACEKLAYVHDPDIIFYRYIDKASGRLVLTETKGGIQLREEGAMMVEGVRFPKKLIKYARDAATGREIRQVISLEKVTLNQAYLDDLFALPLKPGN